MKRIATSEKKTKSYVLKSFFVLSIILTLLIGDAGIAMAGNNWWSSHAIANFLENKVDAPNILQDERYTKNVTREDFAELIVAFYLLSSRIDKGSIPLKENPFNDTDSINVRRAYSLGFIKGISSDEYGASTNMTREEFATIMVRFLNITGIKTEAIGNLNNFIDENEISEWAYNSMLYCVNEGVIKGISSTELAPKSPISVEQAITIQNRLALEYNWFTPSKDGYYSGFFVPMDTELIIFASGEDISVRITWDKILDYEKLEHDLAYMLESKLNNIAKTNNLVKLILSTQSYYANNSYHNNKTAEDFEEIFQLGKYSFRISSSCYSPETWIRVDCSQMS